MDEYKCIVCGKTSDETSIWHDSFGHLEGYHCLECYTKEAVRQNKAAFHLSDIGHNGGWMADYTLADAIDEALTETEESIDQGIGIQAYVGGSYLPALIVYNGNLYVRFADLRWLMDDDTSLDERRAAIEKLIGQLDCKVQIVLPAESKEVYRDADSSGNGIPDDA